jgi:hypothetical protein
VPAPRIQRALAQHQARQIRRLHAQLTRHPPFQRSWIGGVIEAEGQLDKGGQGACAGGDAVALVRWPDRR